MQIVCICCKKDSVEKNIDAYLVMINPGNCHKIKGSKEKINSAFYSQDCVIESVSDMAQKCVMSFTATCNLGKVRILNLSDVVSGNYNEALKKINEGNPLDDSIFSLKRAEQRKRVMPTDAICIAAWGTDIRLKELKKQALTCIGADKIIGIPTDKENYSYRYIKPQTIYQQKEVIKMLSELYLNWVNKQECEVIQNGFMQE